MRLPIKVNFSDDLPVLGVLQDALAFRAKPGNWRKAEYAATKTRAQNVLDGMRGDGRGLTTYEADYFDWGCVLGELARYYKGLEKRALKMDDDDPKRVLYGKRLADAMALFLRIKTQCDADPRVKSLEERRRVYEHAKVRTKVAKKRLKQAQDLLERREREENKSINSVFGG